MIPSFDGVKLFLNKEVAPDAQAVAVIVHGLCEHQGRYDYLADMFHKNGIGTYRFDHRGHGQSEGECAYYDDFNQMLDDVNFIVDRAITENPGKPIFVVGHSMGGFAVSLFGAKYPHKAIQGIVTSGAVTKDNRRLLSDMPRNLDPHMQLPNELGSGVCSVPEVVDWYGKDPLNRKSFAAGLAYQMLDGIEWFKGTVKDFAYPVLMMHGEKDGLVSVQDTYEFFGNVSSTDRQMKIYGGLFHEIFNEYCHDEVIGDAIRWIKNRC
jgi:lysophospholipase